MKFLRHRLSATQHVSVGCWNMPLAPTMRRVHHKIYHQKYNQRNLYCNNCQNEFSALTGTIFEYTQLDIRMWLFAINLVLIARKVYPSPKFCSRLNHYILKIRGVTWSGWRLRHNTQSRSLEVRLNYLYIVLRHPINLIHQFIYLRFER